jgi:hypothetical protein
MKCEWLCGVGLSGSTSYGRETGRVIGHRGSTARFVPFVREMSEADLRNEHRQAHAKSIPKCAAVALRALSFRDEGAGSSAALEPLIAHFQRRNINSPRNCCPTAVGFFKPPSQPTIACRRSSCRLISATGEIEGEGNKNQKGKLS